MSRKYSEVTILGCGAAGSAIAYFLAQKGVQVSVLYRHEDEGSSFTNQKWRHSGLLYRTREMALQIWDAYQNMDPQLELPFVVGNQEAQFVGSDPEILESKKDLWTRWRISEWGLDAKPLSIPENANIGVFGETSCIGGFATPDFALDYPAVIRNLRRQTKLLGAEVISGVSIERLTCNNAKIERVIYSDGTGTKELYCDHCVVAMGAWSSQILNTIGVHPPIRLYKSTVLTFDGELVPRITVWLGDPLSDMPHGCAMNMVPFKGKTLVADTRFTPVSSPDDLAPDKQSAEALISDLRKCFPNWDIPEWQMHGCIKAEEYLGEDRPRTQNMAIYYEESNHRYCHGINGLTVAFPGKASLMFTLAEEVGLHVLNELIGKPPE